MDITTGTVIAFLVLASLLLVILALVMSTAVIYVLVILHAVISVGALAVLLEPLLRPLTCACPAAVVAMPGCCVKTLGLPATSHVTTLMAHAAAFVVVAVWLPFRNSSWGWVLQDLLGAAYLLVVLRFLRLPTLKIGAFLLSAALCYDVFWVYLQPLITNGESAMVHVARGGGTSEAVPMLLRIPTYGSYFQAYTLLGLGDVALPGLLVVYARLVDINRGGRTWTGHFNVALVGYGVGLAATYCALYLNIGGQGGQPALLYLVPCTLIPVIISAASRQELR